MLIDALKYDDDMIFKIRAAYHKQTDFYRAAMEQKTGKRITDRDVSKIPLDQRHRMFSRAAVEGLRVSMD